jgi:hypothetical protein
MAVLPLWSVEMIVFTKKWIDIAVDGESIYGVVH